MTTRNKVIGKKPVPNKQVYNIFRKKMVLVSYFYDLK